jgi:hypothetical protein
MHRIDELRPLRRDGLLVVDALQIAVGRLGVDLLRQQPGLDRALFPRVEHLGAEELRGLLHLRYLVHVAIAQRVADE